MVAERKHEEEAASNNRRRVRAPRPALRPALRVVEPLPLLELVRIDALPEHTEYADSGCELAPSCLRCPLVRCKHDEPGGTSTIIGDARAREIVRMHSGGRASITQLAETYGITRRHVFRILRASRGPSHEP